MATKAELETLYNRYRQACVTVVQAETDRDYHAVVREAEASLPLVHPAVTFRRRFLKADPGAPTIERLLRYAPPLFLNRSLDAVKQWYSGGTKTERNALPDILDQLEEARRTLTLATELWSVLAADPSARLRVDGRGPAAGEIVSIWWNLGLVVAKDRAGHREYMRVSDPRRPMEGKCFECGKMLLIPLTRLLDPYPCPGCRKQCHFVIIRRPD